MAWVYLFVAGLFEICWAIGLKDTDGWTRLRPTVFILVTTMASFYFLTQAVRTIPIGAGYAIWTGIGAIGTAILGIILFSESASATRIACIAIIVVGIVGLKLTFGN